ncbi:unnamed protein product [Vitrella brassicaformis CCMP3155]|uniref:Uncharacterized protein n=1 Tax=Vitrella brassicaformis (strain CCMP3155) TaxID=1169540 RepID=A0A0G4EG46_VITBC|nr:unnamed protein product [Vitrella brassicaformis CCMP3155]|eukprot:CEL94450.1 unnamed protein product [Vitrella brassicaformis CCMP3155]
MFMLEAPHTYNGALPPVRSRCIDTTGKRLRGTGLHGPENTDVFKLVLFNLLKQRRPQLHIATLEEMRDFYKLDVSFVWWFMSCMWIMIPMSSFSLLYITQHDHYPWTTKRLDGSKGPGPFWWCLI